MRKTAILALTPLILMGAAGLGLAGCSEKTQDQAEQTANSIQEDVSDAASDASMAAEKGADRLGAAASEGAASVGKAADAAGDQLKEGAAKVESKVQGEPSEKSKAD